MDDLRWLAPLCRGKTALSRGEALAALVRSWPARHGRVRMSWDARMPRVAALLPLCLLAACGNMPPQGETPYVPSAGMAQVLAERQAMHAKEPARISVAEARDVPNLSDAAHAIPNGAGLPAPDIEVKQFNQPIASG